jgi:hypothetical protein
MEVLFEHLPYKYLGRKNSTVLIIFPEKKTVSYISRYFPKNQSFYQFPKNEGATRFIALLLPMFNTRKIAESATFARF